ncbi:hypothetical protein [uncultured Mediterranean phage uvMED]|nr:hypothetical protein [uncultured Mediterranean phage uvMED]
MSKRTFIPSISRSKDSVSYIRPSELNKNGEIGVVLEGTFEESLVSKFDKDKKDFKFKDEEGKEVIINGAGNLGYQMKAVNRGEFVQIEYLGMQPLPTGKNKGQKAHQFKVLIDVA